MKIPTQIFNNPLIIFVFLLYLICSTPAIGQEKKSKLQEDKKKIEEEIDYTNKLLNETKKSKNTSLNQLVILNKKIKKREDLISNITQEVNLLETKIEINNKKVKQLTKELKTLKDEYAKMIYFAFKNRNMYDRLMFIFASKDFNQAYKRLKYFQQYSAYRKIQAKLIEKTQKDLNTKAAELDNQRNEKIDLLKTKERELGKLQQEKKEKNEAIANLNKREKNLLATLREKEREAKHLQKAIEEIIAEEMHAAAKRAKAEAKTPDATMSTIELALSKNFSTNRGKLPWPSEKGIISSTFGEHQHPVLKKVLTKNNGINILTVKGGTARSVFDGTVVSVRSISNTNKAVFIKHGEYFTVYSNLIDVFVKRGDQVRTRQNIGLIYTNPEDGKTELHFEMWKGKTLLNPSFWIISRN